MVSLSISPQVSETYPGVVCDAVIVDVPPHFCVCVCLYVGGMERCGMVVVFFCKDGSHVRSPLVASEYLSHGGSILWGESETVIPVVGLPHDTPK
jgi:hypothetical protein